MVEHLSTPLMMAYQQWYDTRLSTSMRSRSMSPLRSMHWSPESHRPHSTNDASPEPQHRQSSPPRPSDQTILTVDQHLVSVPLETPGKDDVARHWSPSRDQWPAMTQEEWQQERVTEAALRFTHQNLNRRKGSWKWDARGRSQQKYPNIRPITRKIEVLASDSGSEEVSLSEQSEDDAVHITIRRHLRESIQLNENEFDLNDSDDLNENKSRNFKVENIQDNHKISFVHDGIKTASERSLSPSRTGLIPHRFLDPLDKRLMSQASIPSYLHQARALGLDSRSKTKLVQAKQRRVLKPRPREETPKLVEPTPNSVHIHEETPESIPDAVTLALRDVLLRLQAVEEAERELSAKITRKQQHHTSAPPVKTTKKKIISSVPTSTLQNLPSRPHHLSWLDAALQKLVLNAEGTQLDELGRSQLEQGIDAIVDQLVYQEFPDAFNHLPTVPL